MFLPPPIFLFLDLAYLHQVSEINHNVQDSQNKEPIEESQRTTETGIVSGDLNNPNTRVEEPEEFMFSNVTIMGSGSFAGQTVNNEYGCFGTLPNKSSTRRNY